MEKLFLVCNAHLDPVWLWEWEEGAAAAISTFRVAADFCEQYDGFVFCHNEALLYQWTEEYDMPLFRRIQKLVAAGKWNIMGCWFLQPDANMSSGESILRQIQTGRHYFKEKFNVSSKVALNFDSFGHTRGLVQILAKCGYECYLFMRPDEGFLHLPAQDFLWEGVDGSTIIAHRLDKAYSSILGKALQELEQWMEEKKDVPVSLFPWGVGNHGGGPSRKDLEALNQWMDEHPEVKPVHGTPDQFLAALKESGMELPRFSGSLQPYNVGCYTTQVTIKQLHRALENQIFSTEKLLTAAVANGLMAYPHAELADAQRDLLLSEFHDILPGTSIKPAEAASIRMLDHGLEIMARLRMRGFMAMQAGQPKAGDGEMPVLIYNPHPYPVTGIFECELMPAAQNRDRSIWHIVEMRHNGQLMDVQEEKEGCNINLDWRKRVVFRATLPPCQMSRFDCRLVPLPFVEKPAPAPTDAPLVFDNGEMTVVINRKTGLVDRYCAGGKEFLRPGAFAPVVHYDIPDPWYMSETVMRPEEGRFQLMDPEAGTAFSGVTEATLPSVRIVEDGPIRTVVEAVFRWKQSRLVQTYRLPKVGTEFEVEQLVYWNEKERMLKLEIPALLPQSRYWGQCMFGAEALAMDGTECVSQKWCGLFNEDHALTVVNQGCYGSHCKDGSIYLSLVRSAAYSAHPIDDLTVVRQDRFLPRIDQKELLFRFRICGGEAAQRRAAVDQEAQLFNEAPYALNVFPSGLGEKPVPAVILSDKRVLLNALYHDSLTGQQVIRLWNAVPEAVTTTVELPLAKVCATVTLPPYAFQTYCVADDGLQPVEPVDLEPLA